MMEETGEPRAKLLYLESLRGIAAFVVILSHFTEAFFPAAIHAASGPYKNSLEPIIYGTPLAVLLSGNFSVCLFFVMSGFVLTRPYFLTHRHDLLVSSAVRRYFRLLPPVAVSILVAYALLHFGLFTNQTQVARTGSAWLHMLWAMSASLPQAIYEAFVGAFFAQQVTYNPLLWTMRTEFLGSLLIFAVAAFTGGLARRWLIYIVLVAVFIHSYYLGFLGGMILADYMSTSRHGTSKLLLVEARYLALLIVVGLLLGGFPSDGILTGTAYSGFNLPYFTGVQLVSFWHTLGALSLLVGVVYWRSAQQWLSHKRLVHLGKLSFSLYVTHLIILCTLGTYLFGVFNRHLGYHASFVATLAVTMAAIFTVSAVFCRYVDQTSITNAKMIGRWFMHSTHPAAPTISSATVPSVPVKDFETSPRLRL